MYGAVQQDVTTMLETWRAERLTLSQAEELTGLCRRQLTRLAVDGRLASDGEHRGRTFSRGTLVDYTTRSGARRSHRPTPGEVAVELATPAPPPRHVPDPDIVPAAEHPPMDGQGPPPWRQYHPGRRAPSPPPLLPSLR
jgi:hypothetical protein